MFIINSSTVWLYYYVATINELIAYNVIHLINSYTVPWARVFIPYESRIAILPIAWLFLYSSAQMGCWILMWTIAISYFFKNIGFCFRTVSSFDFSSSIHSSLQMMAGTLQENIIRIICSPFVMGWWFVIMLWWDPPFICRSRAHTLIFALNFLTWYSGYLGSHNTWPGFIKLGSRSFGICKDKSTNEPAWTSSTNDSAC